MNGKQDNLSLAEKLYRAALEIIDIYSPPDKDSSPHLDFEMLRFEAQIEQEHLSKIEELQQRVEEKIQQLYKRLHPSDNVQAIKGIGKASAPVFVSYIGDPNRFNQNTFRGWHGMIPRTKQSSSRDQKGMAMSKAAPNLVKKYAFLSAEVASPVE